MRLFYSYVMFQSVSASLQRWTHARPPNLFRRDTGRVTENWTLKIKLNYTVVWKCIVKFKKHWTVILFQGKLKFR